MAYSNGRRSVASRTRNQAAYIFDPEAPVELKGDFIYQREIVEFYVESNNGKTYCDDQTVLYPAVLSGGTGVVANARDHDFTVSSTGLVTYTGPRTRLFQVSVQMSIAHTEIKMQMTYGVLKNGVHIPGSKIKLYETKETSEINSASIHVLPVLATGDTLQIYAVNETTDDVSVIFEEVNFCAIGISNTV
jgi:hypothetical protein